MRPIFRNVLHNKKKNPGRVLLLARNVKHPSWRKKTPLVLWTPPAEARAPAYEGGRGWWMDHGSQPKSRMVALTFTRELLCLNRAGAMLNITSQYDKIWNFVVVFFFVITVYHTKQVGCWPLEPEFCPDISIRLKDIAIWHIWARLTPIVWSLEYIHGWTNGPYPVPKPYLPIKHCVFFHLPSCTRSTGATVQQMRTLPWCPYLALGWSSDAHICRRTGWSRPGPPVSGALASIVVRGPTAATLIGQPAPAANRYQMSIWTAATSQLLPCLPTSAHPQPPGQPSCSPPITQPNRSYHSSTTTSNPSPSTIQPQANYSPTTADLQPEYSQVQPSCTLSIAPSPENSPHEKPIGSEWAWARHAA